LKTKAFITIFVLVICFAFVYYENGVIVIPKKWPKPSYNFAKNPLSQAGIALGRQLFYDPILSADSSISCASCHSPYNAFTHVDHALSHGIHDSIGTRNSPALINLAWHKNYMWDGAIVNLDAQALAPITHPKEMGENMAHVIQKLKRNKSYPPLFYAAYRDSNINQQNSLLALSQFVLSLISSNSKYDSVMNHQAKFNAQEEHGYALFRNNCASCHTEPLFSNYQFENNGLQIDTTLKDYGRMLVTKYRKDSLLFKVPTLRNIAYTSPYMHDGRFKKLSQVLNHYSNGIQLSATLANQLRKGIHLSKNDQVDVIAFLLTLSDRKFLFNEQFHHPAIIRH
jgi:cytochrome c peroxidase